ncbi:hypothetical protein [Rhodospirillum centenum]|uniref:Uncharacterized protein n=1 Tax=Rhodospirillum centenum (strain ATCC 51521 / SW) TaxID=414684 RepID=B6IVP4_RHOCS|nr:hypothetical protein [Rhodospirillum centenum]ACJ00368.1 conserved hypothetical protein [Rhodospirillum centenum SW]
MSQGIQPGPNRATHFLFDHKVFTLEGARFILSATTEEPVMRFRLGKNDAEVALDKLCAEFNIDPKSFDGQLLDMAARGLKYVRQIKPGDSIPNELLDGTASWRVDEKHYQIARARLTVQLVTWMTGGETVITSLEHLEQVVGDPTTKARVHEAFRMIADRLALSGDVEQEVEKRVDLLAQELAYIEGLRERMHLLAMIRQGLETAHRIYKAERTMREEIVRMQTLCLPPLADLEARFAQVDAQTGEILVMLRKFEQNIAYIREMRDDLHQCLMPWEELLEDWQALQGAEMPPLDKGPALEALLKKTYHFLARRFSQASQWKLANRRPPK